MNVALAALVAYVVGSVPFSALAARMKGVDLRAHGSGNLGATNAIRVLGPKVGVPVLLADVAKGWIAAALVPPLFSLSGPTVGILCGAAAILGHVFPIGVGFRGGKGVATSAGAFLALAPGPIGVAILTFAIFLLTTRIVSLASIAASLTLAIGLWVGSVPLAVRLVGSSIAALVLFRHRGNFARLLSGTEPRVSFSRGGSKR